MAQQHINFTPPVDSVRSGFEKTEANVTELYSRTATADQVVDLDSRLDTLEGDVTRHKDLLKDWRHVSEDGILPGNANNSVLTNTAFGNAAASGQKLVFGTGTYNFGWPPLSMRTGVHIEGQGDGKTILKKSANTPWSLFNMSSSTRFGNVNMSIRGLDMDANGQNQTDPLYELVQIWEAFNYTIEDVRMLNVPARALNAGDYNINAPYTHALINNLKGGTPPEGTDWALNYDLNIRRVKCYSIASATVGRTDMDLFIIYWTKYGECTDIELYGGGANQFGIGFAQDYSVRRTSHSDFWRGFYVETSVNLDIDTPRFIIAASSIINPNLTGQPCICMEIATGDLTYTDGVDYGGYHGGRAIVVDRLTAESLANNANSAGVVAARMIAGPIVSQKSQSITFRDPRIHNLPGANSVGFAFAGWHETPTISGGSIGFTGTAVADGDYRGSRKMVDPTIRGVHIHDVTSVIFQDGTGHSGLAVQDCVFSGNITNGLYLTGGAATQARLTSSGHRNIAGVAMPHIEPMNAALGNYADDAAAATAGVAVGQSYRTGSIIKVRIS